MRREDVPPVPWGRIFTSIPVWALVITHMAQNWGFYTLLTELPTYMKNILHFDMKVCLIFGCRNIYRFADPHCFLAVFKIHKLTLCNSKYYKKKIIIWNAGLLKP